MKTEQLNSNNMETAKNQAFTIIKESIKTSNDYIAQMESRLESLQRTRAHFVKVNAVYYVGDDGTGHTRLTNIVGAYAFPTKAAALHNAKTATYTNNVTGEKFKAEAVLLVQDAIIAEIAKTRESIACFERALNDLV